MRNIALSLLIFISASNIFAQSNGPQIRFDAKEYDYGKIKEEDGPKTCKFYFTNTGKEALLIIDVKPGCGCTTSNYSKNPIQSGKRGEIEATYDPKNRPGPFSKGITVSTNDNTQLSLQIVIKGEVLPKPKTFVDNFPVKLGHLRLSASQANFQTISNTEIRSETVSIYNDWDQNMTLSFTDLPASISIKAVPQSLNPSDEGKIIITYDASKRNDFGFLYDKFLIVTNDIDQPEKGLTVTANISEDFSKLTPEEIENAPVINFDAKSYDFGSAQEGDKVNYSYIFANRGKNDLIVRKTKASCGCTAISPEKFTIKSGESSKINVTFNTTGKTGQQSKTITVTCNDPKNPTVILTIKGLVVKNGEPSQLQANNNPNTYRSAENLKPPEILWITPSAYTIETSDLQYNIKATIKSSKPIKSIKLKSGYTTLATESVFSLTNGQGNFERNITLTSGSNEITIIAENEDGSTTSDKRIIKYTEPQSPPLLTITNSSINFSDKNNNNRIDGNEECSIKFTINNSGKGAARNLKVLVKNNSSVTGLSFSKSTSLGTIAPNSNQKVSIPISGTMDLTSGNANIIISFEEQMGFPPDQFDMNIDTKEFIKPDVKVVDNSFLADNGIIKVGLPIQLKVLIQNVGQGTAENVNVSFLYPSSNVYPNGPKDFAIGTMLAGENKEIVFEFLPNKLYTDKTIPISVKISEKYGKYSQNKDVVANLDTKSSGSTINIASNAIDKTVNIEVASLTSDVDKNIPQCAFKNQNRYALIIGNEDYSSRQTGLGSEVNVAFAVNDAKTFKDYAINTFGIEERNCFLLLNATSGEMSQKIELVAQILSRVSTNGELIFYYAGHGFPDENTKIPYLIPVDVNANNLQSAIKLTDIYNKFSQTKAKRITFFLDACFTGGGRDQGLLAARSVKIKPKEETISGNMVVFAATSEDQSALPYKDKQHGLFTYFLLKILQDSKGDITYGELGKYISENVSLEGLKINGKAQDPKVNVSNDAQNIWESWKIIK
jgi:hypothetical protein